MNFLDPVMIETQKFLTLIKWLLVFARKDWDQFMIYRKYYSIYQRQWLAGLKLKIEKELVLHEIKDIMEDICKVLETIQEIVTHIEQDSSLAKEVLTKTLNDIQSLLKHFSISV